MFGARQLSTLPKLLPAAEDMLRRNRLARIVRPPGRPIVSPAMIELLTTAEMAEADRLTIAGGVPGIELMENAGRAVADAAGAVLQGRRVVIVAGPRQQWRRRFVAARHLAERGYAVRVSFVGDRKRLKGDAALAAERWSGPVEEASPVSLTDCDIVIDALFGAGLDREVEGLPRAMIQAMNAAGVPVIAVDLPSGVNGTTGAVMGDRGQRHPHGDVLPPQDRPPAAAGPAALRHHRSGRYRHPGQRAGQDQAHDLRQSAGALGRRVSAARPAGPQIFARPCGGGVRRPIDHRGGAAGGPRARCGRGRGWSPSPARARPSASMPPPAWRSWCGRWMGRPNWPNSSPTSGAMRWCWGRAAGSARPCGTRSRRRSPATAAVVLDADALTSFADEPAALVAMIAKRGRAGRCSDPARRRIQTII